VRRAEARSERAAKRRSLPAQLDLRPALRRQEAEAAASATATEKKKREKGGKEGKENNIPSNRAAAKPPVKTITTTSARAKAPRVESSLGAQDTERSDRSPGDTRGGATTEGEASVRATSTRTLDGDESAGGTPPLEDPISHVLREREERRRFVEGDDDELDPDLAQDLLRPEWQTALWAPSLRSSSPAAAAANGRGSRAGRAPLRRVLSMNSLTSASASASSPSQSLASSAESDVHSFYYYRPVKVIIRNCTLPRATK
jgi:hypothetical protein